MLLHHHKGIQVRNGVPAEIDAATVIEDRFRIFLMIIRSRTWLQAATRLKESGAGFVITEGMSRCVDKVRLDGDSILVSDIG